MEWTGVQFEFWMFSPIFLKTLCSYDITVGGRKWRDVRPFILWGIWIHMNKVVFEKDKFHAKWVLARALRMAHEFHQVNTDKDQGRKVMQEVFIAWRYPTNGFYKLNTDRASNDYAFAGIGGIIRDSDRDFVACFGKHIYKNNHNVAEVWAIRDGLSLDVELGLRHVEVESDSVYICYPAVQ
ncbi:uncharacterized protein LOC113360635 [Papaver somniferum]|uniref:uncharacterized protein LOC113360635 n=1 Tax=Papaver somniferum TaxID=3469 RepID=UPI000E6FB090|nr:uncharacterized protein LOC113360635 [Papaver somniferum]